MRLRPLVESDRAEFVRVRTVSEELFREWLPAREKSLDELFEEELAKNRMEDRYLRLAGVTAHGRLAGFFNLNEIVRGVFQNAYAAWSVSAEVAGQGYGTEGTRGLFDLAFSEKGLALHRVQANIIPSNAPSLRLAEKVGMRREGLAERYLKIDGQWQDHVMYAKTVEEHELRYLT
jgi:ribosomal-protein-alanine N-acetyltransferase